MEIFLECKSCYGGINRRELISFLLTILQNVMLLCRKMTLNFHFSEGKQAFSSREEFRVVLIFALILAT